MGFIGREKELEKLNGCFGKGQAVLIYGRRRVGKTSLIEEFCKDKRTLFIRCIRSGLTSNLDYISDEIASFTGEPAIPLKGWYDMTRALGDLMKQNIVLVIDEYPFLQKCDPSIDSFMQHLIDRDLKHSGSMLILCGSAVSLMRTIVEDGDGPLYGRFKRIIRLMPLTLDECRIMHPGLPEIDGLKLYLTVGGIPTYHEDIGCTSYSEYIRMNCVEDSWIMDETAFLMKADYKDSLKYESVLSAIAAGNTNAKTIAEYAKIGNSTCTEILKDLVYNGVIDTVHPMLGAAKRPRYFISDYLMSFCHSILFRRRSLVGSEDTDGASAKLMYDINGFLGTRFELFCRDWLSRSYNVLEIGKWWIDDPRRDLHEDIDIVARISVANSKIDLFVECKFRKDEIGFHDYNILCRRAEPFMDTTNCRLMMISVSGFDADLKEYAEGGGVILVGPEEILGHRKAPEIELRRSEPLPDPLGLLQDVGVHSGLDRHHPCDVGHLADGLEEEVLRHHPVHLVGQGLRGGVVGAGGDDRGQLLALGEYRGRVDVQVAVQPVAEDPEQPVLQIEVDRRHLDEALGVPQGLDHRGEIILQDAMAAVVLAGLAVLAVADPSELVEVDYLDLLPYGAGPVDDPLGYGIAEAALAGTGDDCN